MPAAWPDKTTVAIVIGGFLLLAERLFRIAFLAAAESPPGAPEVHDGYPPWWKQILSPRLRRWLPPLLVVAGAVAYGIYMSVFTLRMHGRFQTYNFDLGQYDNIFWSTLHGLRCRRPLGLTTTGRSFETTPSCRFSSSCRSTRCKPAASTLLVLQSFMLGLGAIPIFRFAARRLPRAYAALIAFVYLMYPPMHGLQFYDFHMQPIASRSCCS